MARTKKSNKPRRRVSSLEVAKLAGVSQASVSRTFTENQYVSDRMKTKVLVAAEKLYYHPNAIARGLLQSSTNIIGIVMMRFMNPIYSYILQQFIQRLQKKGYVTLVFAIDEDHPVKDALPVALQYYVDGIVITSATLSSTLAEGCKHTGTPVVLFNRYTSHKTNHSVRTDNIAGGRAIADYLVAGGHKRIALIEGEAKSSTNIDRKNGFLYSLKKHEYEIFKVEKGNYSYESGYMAGKQMLQRKNSPDAIFCANDLMAMGVLDVARYEFGLNIPEDLSVVGFDDIPQASWKGYSLTTFRQPVDLLVAEAVEVLLNAIRKPESPIMTKIIEGELVVRGSTRSPRNLIR